MQFTEVDERAREAFHAALDAEDARRSAEGWHLETTHDREGDYVDGHATEVVRALLAHGWRPPAP